MDVPNPTVVVTKPLEWAKAKPLVFLIFVLAVVLATIRWRDEIVGFLSKIPGVRRLVGGGGNAAPPAPQ